MATLDLWCVTSTEVMNNSTQTTQIVSTGTAQASIDTATDTSSVHGAVSGQDSNDNSGSDSSVKYSNSTG